MKRILIAGTGGGMKGYAQCAVLAEIERRTGRPIPSFCSLYGGTSVAAIVGLAIAAGNSARDTLGFFTEDGPKIFDHTIFTETIDLLRGDRYGANTIESKLQARIGQGMMSECKMNILVPAVDMALRQAFFFKSYDPATSFFKMWEAARASSAAQSYFPAFQCQGRVFWDGGNAANNPAACVLADAVRLWGWDDQFVLLSIGCGDPVPNPNASKLTHAGIIEIGAETLTVQMQASAEVVNYQMRQFLGADFFEIQPKPRNALDDGLPAVMSADAAACIADHSALIDEFCEHIAG